MKSKLFLIIKLEWSETNGAKRMNEKDGRLEERAQNGKAQWLSEIKL